ncbi:MAG: prolyl oligopeptidase family serine peptidase [Bdellovibrionota bacterium]
MTSRALSILAIIFCSFSCSSSPHPSASNEEDPYLWLEEIESERALQWVRGQSKQTLEKFKQTPSYKRIESEIRKITLAKDRVPYGAYRNGWVYDFWQDEKHVRGIWRRTTLSEYKKDKPRWHTLIDVDRLARDEKENWVWKDLQCLPPQYERCLVSLSRGGKDAVVVREFSVRERKFLADGFSLPEAKSRVVWVDEDSLFVGTDFGPGSLTDSGYPRLVKLWKRGHPLSQAQTVFEGEKSDVSVSGGAYFRPQGNLFVLQRNITFYKYELWAFDPETRQKTKADLPEHFKLSEFYKGRLFLILRSDWTHKGRTFKSDSLIAVRVQGTELGLPELVYEPSGNSTVRGVESTKEALYLRVLENVHGKIYELSRTESGWKTRALPLPQEGELGFVSVNPFSDFAMLNYESFLSSPSLYSLEKKGASYEVERLKKLPERFRSKGLVSQQFHAVSADGTKIPYFIIHKKGMRFNSANPTLLYGYGGFQYPLIPHYLGSTGKVWSERGGVYVLANIRGGGEFGAQWHKSVLKENRQKVFDDFIAVAEDLVKRKVTSPNHLGIMGGSNGGLLVGAAFIQRPQLFNAVVCQVPLLDMLRYHKLLAGASWEAEYGNPDSGSTREALLRYSPYQNVKSGIKYPKVFFLTSTKDDRVHPGHARKMVAKMLSQGHEVYYYENIEGGHGAAANLEQFIHRAALEFTYLSNRLGLVVY